MSYRPRGVTLPLRGRPRHPTPTPDASRPLPPRCRPACLRWAMTPPARGIPVVIVVGDRSSSSSAPSGISRPRPAEAAEAAQAPKPPASPVCRPTNEPRYIGRARPSRPVAPDDVESAQLELLGPPRRGLSTLPGGAPTAVSSTTRARGWPILLQPRRPGDGRPDAPPSATSSPCSTQRGGAGVRWCGWPRGFGADIIASLRANAGDAARAEPPDRTGRPHPVAARGRLHRRTPGGGAATSPPTSCPTRSGGRATAGWPTWTTPGCVPPAESDVARTRRAAGVRVSTPTQDILRFLFSGCVSPSDAAAPVRTEQPSD